MEKIEEIFFSIFEKFKIIFLKLYFGIRRINEVMEHFLQDIDRLLRFLEVYQWYLIKNSSFIF